MVRYVARSLSLIGLSVLFIQAVAPAPCMAQNPFKNTPFDPSTWRIPSPPPSESHLPVEPSPGVPPNRWVILNGATSLALDATREGQLIQYPAHGQSNQRWRITDEGNGSHRIINEASGMVLDAAADGRVIQYKSHGGANQQWVIKAVGGNLFTISNVATKRVIGVTNDGRVVQFGNSGSVNQRWHIAP